MLGIECSNQSVAEQPLQVAVSNFVSKILFMIPTRDSHTMLQTNHEHLQLEADMNIFRICEDFLAWPVAR